VKMRSCFWVMWTEVVLVEILFVAILVCDGSLFSNGDINVCRMLEIMRLVTGKQHRIDSFHEACR